MSTSDKTSKFRFYHGFAFTYFFSDNGIFAFGTFKSRITEVGFILLAGIWLPLFFFVFEKFSKPYISGDLALGTLLIYIALVIIVHSIQRKKVFNEKTSLKYAIDQ
jgi:hypothetical protein